MANDSEGPSTRSPDGPALCVDGCSDSYKAAACYQCEFCSRWAIKDEWGPGWSRCPWCHRVERTVAEKRAASTTGLMVADLESQLQPTISRIPPGTTLDGVWEWSDEQHKWILKRYTP